jgi:hypothetical protein
MPNIKVKSHSKDALSICGPPVGVMERVNSFMEMEKLQNIKIIKSEKLGKKSSTFVLHLKKLNLIKKQD